MDPRVIGGIAAVFVIGAVLMANRSPLVPPVTKSGKSRLTAAGTPAAVRFELVRLLAAKWGRLFSVPVPLILTIARIESDFDPGQYNVTPSAMKLGGCWGVVAMGLTTATGLVAQIKKAGLDTKNADVKAALARWHGNGKDLLDADLCLLLGVWMMSGLWIRYKGDYRLVAAAYHQGAGTVDKLVAANRSIPGDMQPLGKAYVTKAIAYWPLYQQYTA